ncbi:MAG: PorV/PorQ family protein [Bacteroidota bacterium]
MRNFSNKAIIAICAIGMSFSAYAGNKDRSGQSGAPEMLINPWARTTGVFGMNTAYVSGIEALKMNIAGLAGTTGTEIGVSRGIYLSGTDIGINNIAVAQSLGEVGVIGINLMSMSFGEIPTTDYFNPEGYGTYRPTFLNVELGYAKEFSSHIKAGAAATYVSEQINNISALGLAFEAGVQYVTGKRDNFHFGITLRNMGTNMRFNGTGFSINVDKPQQSSSFAVTARYPSEKFEIPTYLNIGVAYDLFLDENHLSSKDSMPMHKLTLLGNFTSNSFNSDYLGLGAEYGFRNMFFFRAAYRYEKGITSEGTSTTMYMGVSLGATVQTKFGSGEKAPTVAFDYSFRPTVRPANGVHMLSLRFSR